MNLTSTFACFKTVRWCRWPGANSRRYMEYRENRGNQENWENRPNLGIETTTFLLWMDSAKLCTDVPARGNSHVGKSSEKRFRSFLLFDHKRSLVGSFAVSLYSKQSCKNSKADTDVLCPFLPTVSRRFISYFGQDNRLIQDASRREAKHLEETTRSPLAFSWNTMTPMTWMNEALHRHKCMNCIVSPVLSIIHNVPCPNLLVLLYFLALCIPPHFKCQLIYHFLRDLEKGGKKKDFPDFRCHVNAALV